MSSISPRQKCNSPKTSAQALLARQFLEERGWKVVENQKTKQSPSTSTFASGTNNDNSSSGNEVDTNVPSVSSAETLSPSIHPAISVSSSFSGPLCKFSDKSAASPVISNHSRAKVSSGENANDSIPSSTNALYQRTKRGISNTESNFSIINDIQDLVCDVFSALQVDPDDDNSETRHSFKHTFALPDIRIFPLEFREFLHKELIETSTLVSLEQTGRLNWWYDLKACQRLLPVVTTGDGNCLLHAASLGIWGFHDRRLTLRRALHDMLTIRGEREAFKRRWKYHQEQVNKQSGLIYSEKEWAEEWGNLVKLASPLPRANNDQPQQQQPGRQQTKSSTATTSKSPDIFYESLEELHVFVLAHVLGRPIIIAADTILKDCNGDALAPISFGGVYLPLQISPHFCHRSPLVLSYDSAHFSALVPMKNEHKPREGFNWIESHQDCGEQPIAEELADAIPLVDSSFNLLPIHFFVDPNESVQSEQVLPTDDVEVKAPDIPESQFLQYDARSLSIISKYLDIQVIPISSPKHHETPARPEVSQSFSHLSLKLKSGSCNDIAGVDGPLRSASSTPKSSKVVDSSKDANNGIGGQEEDALSNRSRAPSSASSSPLSKGRMKLPQVAQNVVRTFNSLGRTVKKKMKQTSSSSPFKKATTVERKNSAEAKKGLKVFDSPFRCSSLKRHSDESSTFPSKTVKSVNPDKKSEAYDCNSADLNDKKAVLLERNSVLCAKLIHTIQPYQDEMLGNYLECAWRRFNSIKQNKSAAETNGYTPSTVEVATDCINDGCEGLGTQETSYLCRDCFERHKREEIEHERTNVAAKLLNRKSAAASAAVCSQPPSTPPASGGVSLRNVAGISSSSANNNNTLLNVAGRKRLDWPTSSVFRSSDNEQGEEDGDDGNSNNNNNNNLGDDAETKSTSGFFSPSNKAPPASSSYSSSPSPLVQSTPSKVPVKTQNVTKSTSCIVPRRPPIMTSSPRERKPVSSLSPPSSSYISNFVASSSALGRVESGPKLPIFPGSPGKRLPAQPLHHQARISLQTTNHSTAKSSSLQTTRPSSTSASSSPSSSSSVRNFGRLEQAPVNGNVNRVWSSRGSLSVRQPQQHYLQHSQQQLQQSLQYLQQQSRPKHPQKSEPSQDREVDRALLSRRFEENLEQELYTMSQCVRHNADATYNNKNKNHSTYRNYSGSNGHADGDGDYSMQRESAVRCQQYEF